MPKDFQIKGLENAQKLLKGLDGKFTKKVIENTFRKSAQPLVKKAKELAPKGPTGNLKKSIGIFVSKGSERKRNLKAGLWVGPRVKGQSKGYHAHLVEFGTEDRTPKKGRFLVFEYNGVLVFAKRTEGMKPNPFMRPAWEQTKGQVEAGVIDNIEQVFLREIKKAKG
ncbi:HK97-gp10 family putative phage morphogenesis protein [Chondrinema litorale]|uniref:HK97-gp10 family putative phage morphogenesis protein n=1 Tax=Chondrinema litorale TaxID=2994555 RepID=UPI0025436D18|nr:HK97-gp10 family putative phage morphogenesis protein [Chondrinema litorale]UZS00265.1 HK97 gp10 family phage protein [Chondrinema litorale]